MSTSAGTQSLCLHKAELALGLSHSHYVCVTYSVYRCGLHLCAGLNGSERLFPSHNSEVIIHLSVMYVV